MKVISFDIGIKNMAYCILSVSGEATFSITDWNCMNLMDNPSINTMDYKCTQKIKKTNSCCTKSAKYKKQNEYYCENHAKKCSLYILPKQCHKLAQLKKNTIEELHAIVNEHSISLNGNPPSSSSSLTTKPDQFPKKTKKELLQKIAVFFENKCFEPIVPPKKKTANDTDLIQIGVNMNIELNKLDSLVGITHVVIENQISPIATRMKTIQGMLMQYFIIKYPSVKIDFVSSSNKLKSYIPKENNETNSSDNAIPTNPTNPTNPTIPTNTIEKMYKKKYKKNKMDGIDYCFQLFDKNKHLEAWRSVLNTKKKDDLADCFLQGVWYIQKEADYSISKKK